MMNDWIAPDWTAPANVRAAITTRAGGVSRGAYASFNLGDHVGDRPEQVRANRALLRAALPAEPVWLRQVHGIRVARADHGQAGETADAAVARRAGVVCVVLTADCLPILLCDRSGTVVAAAHAGWRGLAAGIVEATLEAMDAAPETLLAYLGPAIGPRSFEVGTDVHAAFVGANADAAAAFRPRVPGKWLADLYQLARQRLAAAGVPRVWGGAYDTFTDAQRFYSFRRDGNTGRNAALIWRTPPARSAAPGQ